MNEADRDKRAPPTVARFSLFSDLSAGEVEALEALSDDPRSFKRGHVLRREGDAKPGLYLLHKGWAASCMTFPGGGRQYFKIHSVGDVMGAPSLPLVRAADTLVSFTEVTVSHLPPDRLSELFARHPRLAMMFFLSAQVERTVLMDHIAALGRCTAEQRMAGFLVHIAEQAHQATPHPGDAFELPLTQQQIGDVLGLTPVHVNRVLRAFDLSGHIRRYRKWIELLRRDDLRALSGLPRREVARGLPWLPAV